MRVTSQQKFCDYKAYVTKVWPKVGKEAIFPNSMVSYVLSWAGLEASGDNGFGWAIGILVMSRDISQMPEGIDKWTSEPKEDSNVHTSYLAGYRHILNLYRYPWEDITNNWAFPELISSR